MHASRTDLSRSSIPVIDWSTFEALRVLDADGSGKVAQDLVRLFLSDGAARVAEIQRAFNGGDLEKVSQVAHALKTSAACLGAIQLRELCQSIEAKIRYHHLIDLASLVSGISEAFSLAAQEFTKPGTAP